MTNNRYLIENRQNRLQSKWNSTEN